MLNLTTEKYFPHARLSAPTLPHLAGKTQSHVSTLGGGFRFCPSFLDTKAAVGTECTANERSSLMCFRGAQRTGVCDCQKSQLLHRSARADADVPACCCVRSCRAGDGQPALAAAAARRIRGASWRTHSFLRRRCCLPALRAVATSQPAVSAPWNLPGIYTAQCQSFIISSSSASLMSLKTLEKDELRLKILQPLGAGRWLPAGRPAHGERRPEWQQQRLPGVDGRQGAPRHGGALR